tara:strand:- start:8892 stop:10031 length:1140 start_codon:yes stop_codon:yes gene_type:complete
MKFPLNPVRTAILTVLIIFAPVTYTHAMPIQKVDINLSYKDTHINKLSSSSNDDSNDTHSDSTPITHANVAASSAMDVSQTSLNYKDTHINQRKSPLNVSSNDTHANIHPNPDSNANSHFLTQVPYSALGVLPMREHDSQFSYGEDPLQTVYVWHGRNGVQSRVAGDAIIFVHGGCWLNAYGYDHAKGFYNALAELGVGVFAIEYRRVGDEGGGWPGSLNDVTEAVKASLEKIVTADDYRNIFVVGHSAGGHLALLAAQQLSRSDLGKNIKQVIGLAAITNVQSYALGENSCQTATPQFMQGLPSEKEHEYQLATPVATDIQPSVTLLQGNEDSIVPEHHATMSGAKNRIITNGGHFDWLHPDSSSFDALLEVLGKHDK